MSTNIINSKDFLIILNLSTNRDDWGQICNDATATRATKVAQEVLLQLQKADNKIDKLQTFTQKLELLNGKFIELTHQSPLSTVIQRLKENRDSSPNSVKQLKTLFTISPSSEHSAKKEVSSIQISSNNPLEKLLERFQENIRKLDLASPLLSQRIEAIKEDLKHLEKMGLFSTRESYAISGLLDALKKGNTLFFHLPGDDLISLLSEVHPELKIDHHHYHEAKKMSQEQAQSDLLKIFKGNCDSPEQLSKALQPAYDQLLNQIYQTRLSFALSSEQLKSECFNRYFMTNFSKLAALFEKYTSTIASEMIDQEIKKITKELDDRSSGGFSKLVKFYSYLDMNQKYSEFIKFSQKNLINSFDLKEINQTAPHAFDNLTNNYLNNSKKISLISFHYIYNEFLKLRHEWLADYAHCIKKPYNQKDDSETPGRGCCFNNSIDRFWVISEFPDLPGKDIPMKSSQEGRFTQARTMQAFHQRDMGKLTPQEAEEIQVSAAQRHGLKQAKKININSSPQKDPKQNLIDEITKVYKNNPQIQFILSLYSSETAHAFNIQLNESKNIFRFMDDNLGVCEFANFAEFQKGFLSYMNAFHTKKNQFSFRFFEKE